MSRFLNRVVLGGGQLFSGLIDIITPTPSPTARTLLTIGQSNAERMQINAAAEMKALLDAADPSSSWMFADGAADGSALFKGSLSNNNWWINTNGSIGPRWQDALDAIAAEQAAGRTVSAFYMNQGEGDAYYVGLTQANIDEWGAGWLTVFASLRAAAGGSPRIYWVPMNRRGDEMAASQNGYTNLRRKIAALCAANPSYLTLMPEMFDQSDDGGPHTDAAGYKALAPRMARKINKVRGFSVSVGVDGPRITAAARNAAVITATVVHDGGTDITPATGAQGFVYTIDGVDQTISSVNRADATHWTITLPANVAQGTTETLRFAVGTMPTITDYTKIARDNSAVPLPFRFAEVVATVANAASPPAGPAPSTYVADPTVESASNFDQQYATETSIAGGKIKVRQASASIWSVRIKGQAEVASGTPTKQLIGGRTYRLTATSSTPTDGATYSGNWSFVMDATNTNINSGAKIVSSAFQTSPGILVATLSPASDSYVGVIQRGSSIPGNMDLDNFIIEDIT